MHRPRKMDKWHIPVASRPEYPKVVWDLQNTTLKGRELSRKYGLNEQTIAKIARMSNARNPLVIRTISKGMGLDYERLPDAVKPLTTDERQRAISENIMQIRGQVGEIPAERRHELETKVKRRIFEALRKYHDGLMDLTQFVTLVAQREVYNHRVDELRKFGQMKANGLHSAEGMNWP